MTGDQAIVEVIRALNELSIPYMMVGALSVNCYAVPRSTHDADFVLEMEKHSVAELANELGSEFELEQQMGFETITASTQYLFYVKGTQFKIELFLLQDNEYHQVRFQRRLPIEFFGQTAFVQTPEDVVVTKLRWASRGWRDKDKEDAMRVLAATGRVSDWAFVEQWCERFETRPMLEELREKLKQKNLLD